MNKKAEKFIAYLKEHDISAFAAGEEFTDEFHTVLYRSNIEVEGQKLPIALILDDTVFSIFRVHIADKVIKNGNSNILLEHLNELNRKYKIFKYYITEQDNLCLDCCVTATDEMFSWEIVSGMIDLIIEQLTEHYPILMKKIWSN